MTFLLKNDLWIFATHRIAIRLYILQVNWTSLLYWILYTKNCLNRFIVMSY